MKWINSRLDYGPIAKLRRELRADPRTYDDTPTKRLCQIYDADYDRVSRIRRECRGSIPDETT